MRKSSKPRKRLTYKTIALTIILALTIASWQPVQAQRSRRGTRTTKVSTTKEKTNKGNNYDETKAVSLIDNFVNSSKSDSPQPDITPIRNYYNGLNNAAKQQMLTHLTDKTTQLLEGNNKTDALAHTRLYSALAPSNDEKLPTMLYIQGTIYAENLDSASLKQTILTLNKIHNPVKQEAITEFSKMLNVYLEKSKTNGKQLEIIGDGEWVSSTVKWNDHLFYKDYWVPGVMKENAAPQIWLKTDYNKYTDTTAFIIDGCCPFKHAIDGKITSGMISLYEDNMAQYILPYGSDSIYVMWCSEQLNRNSPEFATFMRGVVSTASASITAEFAQRNLHSFGTELGMNLLTNVLEIGVNALLDILFTPSKKMYCLEGRFKVENELTMTGILKFQVQKINAEGKSETKTTSGTVTLHRWLPENEIMFDRRYLGLCFHPSKYNQYRIRDTDKYFKEIKEIKRKQKQYEKDKTTRWSYWKKNGTKKNRESWNDDQYKWLVLYNDSVLASHGVKSHLLDNVTPDVGLKVVGIPDKVKKKVKMENGAFVEDVELIGAANVAGIKQKDIIIAINGMTIDTGEDFYYVVRSAKPGDWLNCSILRNNKQIMIPIRVTWK